MHFIWYIIQDYVPHLLTSNCRLARLFMTSQILGLSIGNSLQIFCVNAARYLSRVSSALQISRPNNLSVQLTRQLDMIMHGESGRLGPLGTSQARMEQHTTWMDLHIPPHLLNLPHLSNAHGIKSLARRLVKKSTGFHPSPRATRSVRPKVVRWFVGTFRPIHVLRSGTQANAGSSGNVVLNLKRGLCTSLWLKFSMHRECLSNDHIVHLIVPWVAGKTTTE